MVFQIACSDGWGPSEETKSDVPYAPFSKSDKLGKVADWTTQEEVDTKQQYRRHYRNQNRNFFFSLQV